MYLALVFSDIFRLSNLKCYKACGLHALTSDTELNKKNSGKDELEWNIRTCIDEQFLLKCIHFTGFNVHLLQLT